MTIDGPMVWDITVYIIYGKFLGVYNAAWLTGIGIYLCVSKNKKIRGV